MININLCSDATGVLTNLLTVNVYVNQRITKKNNHDYYLFK